MNSKDFAPRFLPLLYLEVSAVLDNSLQHTQHTLIGPIFKIPPLALTLRSALLYSKSLTKSCLYLLPILSLFCQFFYLLQSDSHPTILYSFCFIFQVSVSSDSMAGSSLIVSIFFSDMGHSGLASPYGNNFPTHKMALVIIPTTYGYLWGSNEVLLDFSWPQISAPYLPASLKCSIFTFLPPMGEWVPAICKKLIKSKRTSQAQMYFQKWEMLREKKGRVPYVEMLSF